MGMNARTVARLATAAGVVGLVATLSLAIFFAVGGPFGSINDWTIALLGVLSGLLVLATRQISGTIPAALGIVGAVVVVIGAALVITTATGFVFAGFVESLGFALIGAWLIARSRATGSDGSRLGLVAGILMLVGIVVLPDVFARVDRMEDVSLFGYLGWIGWLGIFILYPIWAIRTGRAPGGASA